MEKLTDWSAIEMKADKAKITIAGYIGFPEEWQFDENMAEKVVSTKEKMRAELEKIANLKSSVIEVDIDSFGGSINHGMAIYNALALNKSKVIINYVGCSASAATVIGAAGDEVNAPSNTLLLIHEARGTAYGKQNDLQSAADLMKNVNLNAAKIYSIKSGKSVAEMLDVMGENRGEGNWKTADQMKEIGLIDNVIEPMQMAASFEDYKQKAKMFNINHDINMSLFSKKEKQKALNSVVFGEVNAVYEGELKEGSELAGIGCELQDGNYESGGKVYTIENSIVKSISEKEPEMVLKEEMKTAVDAKQSEIDALNTQMSTKDAEIEALKKENGELKKLAGNHKPKKLETVENIGEMSAEEYNIHLSKKLNTKGFGRTE